MGVIRQGIKKKKVARFRNFFPVDVAVKIETHLGVWRVGVTVQNLNCKYHAAGESAPRAFLDQGREIPVRWRRASGSQVLNVTLVFSLYILKVQSWFMENTKLSVSAINLKPRRFRVSGPFVGSKEAKTTELRLARRCADETQPVINAWPFTVLPTYQAASLRHANIKGASLKPVGYLGVRNEMLTLTR